MLILCVSGNSDFQMVFPRIYEVFGTLKYIEKLLADQNSQSAVKKLD